MSYTQVYYHIILRTKHSKQSLPQEHVSELYQYIWGIITNRKGKLYRINGMEDHVHIFTSIHPSTSLASLVKDIKVASNLWMKTKPEFTEFSGWGEGYAAFTRSYRERESVITYIKNQQEHHRAESFQHEIKRLFNEEGMVFDERFLE